MTMTTKTAKQFIVEQYRHEINGEWEGDSLNDLARECFNAGGSEVDARGDVFIYGALTSGHWANKSQLVRFARFVADRCNLPVEITA